MRKKIINFIQIFVFSLAFIAIFVFVNALFVNWSLLTNLCVAVGVSCFGVTLWKWTFNIIAFKRSGMKLPEDLGKEDLNKNFLNDIVTNPALAELGCNVWHGTAADRTSDFWIADPFQDQD